MIKSHQHHACSFRNDQRFRSDSLWELMCFSNPRWTWFARSEIFRTTLLPISNYTPWIKFWNSVRIKVITRNNICTGEVSKFSFSWFYEADPKVVILHDDNPRCGSQSTFQQSTWEHNKTQTDSCPSAARFFYTKFLKVIVSKFLSVPTGKSHIVAKHKEWIEHLLVNNPTNTRDVYNPKYRRISASCLKYRPIVSDRTIPHFELSFKSHNNMPILN